MSEDNLSCFGEWRRDFARDVADDPETTILTEHLDGYDTTEEEPPVGGALAGGQQAGGAALRRACKKQSAPPTTQEEADKMAQRVRAGAITLAHPTGMLGRLKTEETKAQFQSVEHQSKLWSLREKQVRERLLDRLSGEMYKDMYALFDKAVPESVHTAWTVLAAKFMNQVEQLLTVRMTCLREGRIHASTKESDRTIGMHKDERPTAYIRLLNDLVKEIRSLGIDIELEND
jgi:hypothetical protein